jgi:hypothetical protein
MVENARMKKFFAIIVALFSAWVLFTPFDLHPFLFDFFIDEAIALLLFTKAMAYLGFDVTRFLPFMNKRSGSQEPPPFPGKQAPTAKDTVIDV